MHYLALLNHKPTLTGSDGKKLNEINQEIKDDAKAALNNIKYGQSNDDNAMHIKTLLTKLSSGKQWYIYQLPTYCWKQTRGSLCNI